MCYIYLNYIKIIDVSDNDNYSSNEASDTYYDNDVDKLDTLKYSIEGPGKYKKGKDSIIESNDESSTNPSAEYILSTSDTPTSYLSTSSHEKSEQSISMSISPTSVLSSSFNGKSEQSQSASTISNENFKMENKTCKIQKLRKQQSKRNKQNYNKNTKKFVQKTATQIVNCEKKSKNTVNKNKSQYENQNDQNFEMKQNDVKINESNNKNHHQNNDDNNYENHNTNNNENENFLLLSGIELFTKTRMNIDGCNLSQVSFPIEPMVVIPDKIEEIQGIKSEWLYKANIIDIEKNEIKGAPGQIIKGGFLKIIKKSDQILTNITMEQEIKEMKKVLNHELTCHLNKNDDIYVIRIYTTRHGSAPYCIPYKVNNKIIAKPNLQRHFLAYLTTTTAIIRNISNKTIQ